MRQAKALMSQYSIDDSVVKYSDVNEVSVTAGATSFPIWVSWLSKIVARAFSCTSFLYEKTNTNQIVFIGVNEKPTLASYAFTVLRRKLNHDRKAFYKTTRGKRANRIGRADQFSMGWLIVINKEVERFADAVPDVALQYLNDKGLGKFKPREHGNGKKDNAAVIKGIMAAGDVSLRHGVDGVSTAQITSNGASS